MVRESSGDPSGAVLPIAAARRYHMAEYNYHGRAIAFALATEALLRFKQERLRQAARLASEALEWAERHHEKGSIYSQVADVLARYQVSGATSNPNAPGEG